LKFIFKIVCILPILFFLINKLSAQPLVIAHRGASAIAPENTLAAINKAIEIGADVVEVDVHLTKDEQLIVIHDKNLKRTTGINKSIKNCNYNDIKQLNVRNRFLKEYPNQTIPTLKEVIQTINRRCKLLIEIKEGSPYYPDIEQKVLDLIKELNAEDFCLMHSFVQAAVYTWESFNSSVPVSLLKKNRPLKIWSNKLIHTCPILDTVCYSNNYYYRFITKRFVKQVHRKNQKIFVWTVNNTRIMKRMVRINVDGIITNNPDKLIRIIADAKNLK